MSSRPLGTQIPSSENLLSAANLDHLAYADDIAILAESYEDLRRACESMARVFASHGLVVNFGKTKFMVFNAPAGTPAQMKMGNGTIERVSEFVYLGSMFTENLDDKATAAHRLEIAQGRYGQMQRLLSAKNVSARLKSRALNAFILPCATWACGAWVLTQNTERYLDTWWNKKQRRICGLTKKNHVRTEEILARTGGRPLSNTVRERRLRYYGHAMRYGDSRWVRKLLGATQQGKLPPNKRTWRRDIAKDLRSAGATEADCLDREKWKKICKEIASTAATQPGATQTQDD